MNKILLILLFALAALPPSAAAPLDEARAALKANQLTQAATLLEPLTGPEARDAAAFHILSQVRLAQKNLKSAVELAEKATAFDGTQPAYFSQLGMALGRRMGEVSFMEQAALAGKLRRAFARAVELDPNDLPGLIGLARFYSQAPEIAGGSVEKAREFAQRVHRIDPFLGEVELGNIDDRDENSAGALGHFEAAAKLKPGSAGVQNSCGQMLAKLGRKDEARTRFADALKIDPAFEPAQKSLAALDAPAP